jgi:hypothetical protein
MVHIVINGFMCVIISHYQYVVNINIDLNVLCGYCTLRHMYISVTSEVTNCLFWQISKICVLLVLTFVETRSETETDYFMRCTDTPPYWQGLLPQICFRIRP